MTTCTSTLASGEPCNAPALNSGTCCRHHDPNRPHSQASQRSREYQPFGLQMASNLMTELDQMAPYSEEEYGSSSQLPVAQAMNSPEQIEKLEQRRSRLQAAGDHAYVPTQEEMQGFMANFECANAKKLAERIAAKRNAFEKQRALWLASRTVPHSSHSPIVR